MRPGLAIAAGLGLVVLIAVVSLSLGSERSQAPTMAAVFTGPRGGIVFMSERDGRSYELYAMGPDGTGEVRLTNTLRNERSPDVSSDGTQIVYYGNERDGNERVTNYQIYVMGADGRNVRRLSRNPAVDDEEPVFSPDGTKVAFDRGGDDHGGDVTREIVVMNADGTGATTLTHGGLLATRPAFSPDGSKIVFYDAFEDDIYVMDALTGKGLRALTRGRAEDLYPSYSPDGRQIAFTRNRRSEYDIYVMNADGSHVQRVTHTPAEFEGRPTFSPDGSRIAFDSAALGLAEEVAVVNVDGTGRRTLAGMRTNNSEPRWAARISSRPAGRALCPQGTSATVRCRRGDRGRLAMIGTARSETFVGSAGRDRISASGGDDTVRAGAGDDLVGGGDGNDTLDGGAGDDRLNGNRGRDHLRCGPGRDTARASREDIVDGTCERRPR